MIKKQQNWISAIHLELKMYLWFVWFHLYPKPAWLRLKGFVAVFGKVWSWCRSRPRQYHIIHGGKSLDVHIIPFNSFEKYRKLQTGRESNLISGSFKDVMIWAWCLLMISCTSVTNSILVMFSWKMDRLLFQYGKFYTCTTWYVSKTASTRH